MSSKSRYKTSFQGDWLTNNEFSSWLKKIDGNVHCAKYRVGQSVVTWTCMFGIGTIIKTT